jgi:molybdopterin-guanine dinucleotide biosynthesis protein B
VINRPGELGGHKCCQRDKEGEPVSLTPIISFLGKAKRGKTTFLEKVIAELKRRGWRVATIKHHSHPGLELDRPGKDTWRMAQAGADRVVISSPGEFALIGSLEKEQTLDELAALLPDVDIILTEGYRQSDKPKIEVCLSARSKELICREDELLAIVSDLRFPFARPHFGLDDAAGVVDLLESTFLPAGR